MIFVYRLLPAATALAVGILYYAQFENSLSYPWIAVLGTLAVMIAAWLMSRTRVSLVDMVEKMLPTFLLLGVLVFGMLLSEGELARWAIIVLAVLSSFLSLELLFLLSFTPSRYPVNGLSHVNIALVPFILWYTVSTSVGLIAFLHSSKWIYVALVTIVSVILFRTTGHPGATKEQNMVWMFIGGAVGLHVGLLSVMLPLSMAAQGAMACLIFCVVLRMRRYLYHPIPGKQQAWMEGLAALVLIITLITTSRWL